MAWSLATGAAVALSWWGVRAVMTGTVYDRPAAVPLAAVPESPAPQASSTHRSEAGPFPRRRRRAPRRPRPLPRPAAPAPGGGSPVPPPAVPAGRTAPRRRRPSRARCGVTRWRAAAAFSLGDRSAELVSATPASGWRMQVWKQDTWIRVTFTGDGREVSVFCVWHDTAPRVEIDERPA